MSLKSISPQAASELVNQGAVLVDIRAANEHARERIATACHVPMDRLRSGGLPLDGAPAVIFHCRSGNRTRVNASVLGACTACDAYVLEGGLDAWKKAGLPVVADARVFRHGFNDQSAEIWSDDGVLLAVSHQVVWFKG